MTPTNEPTPGAGERRGPEIQQQLVGTNGRENTPAGPETHELEDRLRELYPARWATLLVLLESREKRPIESGWNAAAMARWEANGDPAPRLAEVVAHLEQGGNLGLAAPPGFVVLDADDATSAAWLAEVMPDAPRQRTAHGAHFIARLPAGLTLAQAVKLDLGDGVSCDLRTAGRGQIACEPSIHPSGVEYAWELELPLDPEMVPMLPAGLVERMKGRREQPSSRDGNGWGEGHRNDRLFARACALRRAGLGETEIRGALLSLNRERCHPPLPDAEVALVAASAAREPKGTSPQLSARVASGIERQSVRWLWDRYLPAAKIVDAYGDGDMGKSMVLLDIAARVSRGDRMPDGAPGVEGPILIFAAEDDAADTIVPRLEAAGANLDRCHIFEGDFDGPDGRPGWLSIPDHLEEIRRLFRDIHPGLAIFDPVMAFMGSTKTGIDADVRAALGPLKTMASECGTTIVNLRHINKSTGSSANMRGTASTAFRNLARAGLVFGEHPEDDQRRVMAPNKSNLCERPPSLGYSIGVDRPGDAPTVRWLGPVPYTAGEILGGPDRPGGGLRPGTKGDDCSKRIRDLLEDGPLPAREIEDMLTAEGFGIDTVKKAKRAAGASSTRTAQGWQWTLE